jgi:hypothetical protein
MASSSSSPRAKVIWLVIFLAISLASAGGVAIRVMGYPAVVPQAVKWALTGFIEPGLTIWWFTLGAAFQAFPSNGLGYAVTIGANIAFWHLIATPIRFFRQRIGPSK